MFTFTPLLGAQSASPALQSLLEFDGGVKILIDVGWDTGFNGEKLKDVERHVSTISLILLTHPTIAHLGAYAHCCKHVPLFSRIPVYATAPVISLGRTLLQDLYASTPLASSLLPASAFADSSLAYTSSASSTSGQAHILLQPPSNEDIASYFSVINSLKYSQPHQPLAAPSAPPLDGLVITAYGSGHTLGGSIWHLQHASESVVYAVDWNHARENLLPGAAWLSGASSGAEVIEQLRKPTALVCSSKGAQADSLVGGWRKRDELLLHHVRATVARGASVLIPCDTSARCLELAYVIERAFLQDAASFGGATPYLASRTCSATIRYARSMLEWMDESVVREFEASAMARAAANNSQRDGPGSEPFNFEYMRLIERPTQLHRTFAAAGPKIFLASDSTIEWGFSRDILQRLGSDGANLLVLTDRLPQSPASSDETSIPASTATLCDAIRKLYISKVNADGIAQCSDDTVELKSHTISPLAANDQQYYQQWLAHQRQRQNAAPTDNAARLETLTDAVDDQSSSTSSSEAESDDEHQGKVLNVSNALTHSKHKLGLTDEELGVNVLLRRRNAHDFDVRGKRGREKLFPYVAKRQRKDEFGEVIRPEEYLRAEEKEDLEATAPQTAGDKTEATVGQKRRWDARGQARADARTPGALKHRKGMDDIGEGMRTRIDSADEDVDKDDSDESEYEPDEPAVLGPTKVSFGIEQLSLSARLVAVDFSSIHDKQSLRTLIPLIAPRKLILTGGDASETDFLADECRKLLGKSGQDAKLATDVFAPANGVSVEASVDTNAWTIKLSRALYQTLKWQTFRGLGIVTIDGWVQAAQTDKGQADDGNGAVKRQKLDESKAQDSQATESTPESAPVLDMVPTNVQGASRATGRSLHVGDLRLAELRRLLQANGHLAEFKGEGTLLVDGMVAVRKNGVGRIEVEGGWVATHGAGAPRAGASFFNVKRKIYEGLAVVAAR